MSACFKACACGCKFTQGEWQKLPLLGYLYLPADEDGPETHDEYRNCFCGSTLAVAIDPPKEISCSCSL